MIAHPPCTHLAVSGARWFAEKRREQAVAIQFVRLGPLIFYGNGDRYSFPDARFFRR